MKTVKKSDNSCEQCKSLNLKTAVVTYPVKIGAKQLNVARVSVKECMDCHYMKPTKAGEEKIARCSMTWFTLFDRL